MPTSNYKILNLDTNFKNIANFANIIKEHFKVENCNYVVIKNNNQISDCNNIITYYELLNECLGTIIPVNKEKYTDENQGEYWVNIEYNCHTKSLQPWKTNKPLPLHTDNTVSDFANITELVCIHPCKYSGETVIISNNYIVELIKYNDVTENDTLFDEILNRKIYFNDIERTILEYDEKNTNYIFMFNKKQAQNSILNTENDLKLIEKIAIFLEEKITNSCLMDEIKLDVGDALLFNDTKVIHGRRSVFGDRFYKKCSILVI